MGAAPLQYSASFMGWDEGAGGDLLEVTSPQCHLGGEGYSLHSPSAQPLPGWTLQSEVLMREAGTCFLLCAWLSLGVPSQEPQ